MRTIAYLSLATLLLCAPACGNDDDATTPTSPTPTNVTETFSGSINRNGAATHNFTSSQGLVTGTLTMVSLGTEVEVGFSLGTWNGLTCAIVLANDKAKQGDSVSGSVNAPGSLCARVYDVGNIPNTMDYEIQIVHPQ